MSIPRLPLTLAALLALFPAGIALALQPLPGPDDPRVVTDAVLTEQRGGFFGPAGLQIAIGLEQMTAINDEVVHRSVLRELAPLNRNARSLTSLEQVRISTGLDGPTVQRLDDHSQGWVTVIQNELDGQQIQHQTLLQLQLDNLVMPRSDLSRSLERGLVDAALGP